MRNIVFGLTLLAAVATANPVLGTILNEAGLYPDSTAWLELCSLPLYGEDDLTGWRIVTSTSACTLSCWLRGWGIMLIDSSSLADRDSARGTFRLNPIADTIKVYRDTESYPFEKWAYGPQIVEVPTPSVEASTSFWNEAGAESQSMSWWADSTPTPGYWNDDFSRILGRLTVGPGETLHYVWVDVDGVTGSASACEWNESLYYRVNGLAPGRYQVTASAYMASGRHYSEVYPESVEVGYSQTVTGIDFTLPPTGLADVSGTDPRRPVPEPTMLRGATGIAFYDAQGRRVSEPNAGVYFLREQGRTRKVVIAR